MEIQFWHVRWSPCRCNILHFCFYFFVKSHTFYEIWTKYIFISESFPHLYITDMCGVWHENDIDTRVFSSNYHQCRRIGVSLSYLGSMFVLGFSKSSPYKPSFVGVESNPNYNVFHFLFICILFVFYYGCCCDMEVTSSNAGNNFFVFMGVKLPTSILFRLHMATMF